MRTAPARPVASHPIPWHPLEKKPKKSFSRISGAKSQGEEDIRYKWPAAAREEGSANETYVICSQAFLLFFITVSINGKAEWSRHQRHWLPFIEVTHWGCASIDVPISIQSIRFIFIKFHQQQYSERSLLGQEAFSPDGISNLVKTLFPSETMSGNWRVSLLKLIHH